MAMCAVSVIPILVKSNDICEALFQVWCADDASGAGSIAGVRQWSTLGPAFGYYPKTVKTCLVLCPDNEEAFRGVLVFRKSGTTITSERNGHLELGSLLC